MIIFCCFHKTPNWTYPLGRIRSCYQAEWIRPENFRRDSCNQRRLARWMLFFLIGHEVLWEPASSVSPAFSATSSPPCTPRDKHTQPPGAPQCATHSQVPVPLSQHVTPMSRISLQSHSHQPVKYFHIFPDLVHIKHKGIPYQAFFDLNRNNHSHLCTPKARCARSSTAPMMLHCPTTLVS